MRLTPALALLAFGWLILAGGLVVDARRGSPEATLRTYLVDLEAHRTEAALGALAPDAVESWRDFVEFQQFNRYDVVSLAVRSPSLLDSFAGHVPWQATDATLVADIVEPSGLRWRGSTVVPVEQRGGRWVLERPPFAP